MTLSAYWMVTHQHHRRKGLWLTLFTEFHWMGIFWVMAAWGFIPVSIATFIITVQRLLEPPPKKYRVSRFGDTPLIEVKED